MPASIARSDAQRLVNPSEIVIHEIKRERVFMFATFLLKHNSTSATRELGNEKAIYDAEATRRSAFCSRLVTPKCYF
jgi:hypothetical protein